MQRLTQVLDFQSQALVLRGERQRLIASNIANADTPGYVARDMDFAGALRQATASAAVPGAMAAAGGPPGALLTTNAGHIAPAAGAAAEPDLVYAAHSQDSIDRNTVDLERERATFADNTLMYEATLRFIGGSARAVMDAMKSYNQG